MPGEAGGVGKKGGGRVLRTFSVCFGAEGGGGEGSRPPHEFSVEQSGLALFFGGGGGVQYLSSVESSVSFVFGKEVGGSGCLLQILF